MNALSPFHLAVPVRDLEKARIFYRETLGFEEGRSSDHWVDFDFFGHQFVIHLDTELRTKTAPPDGPISNSVDGKQVPVPHFGVVLPWEHFLGFSEKLKQQNIRFIIEPCVRFKGKPGEQMTMFFNDPSGNALEFKAFKSKDNLFAKQS